MNNKTTRELSPAEALLAMDTDGGLEPESVYVPECVVDGSSELYEQVRTRITRPGGLFFMGKGIIGFPDLTTRAHMALALMYERTDIAHLLCEFPKSHLKTTLGTVTKVLWRFSTLAIRGNDLWERIGIGSNTKTNAKRFLRLIKMIPESNTIFQHFVPELLPEFSNEEVWNQDEIIFPRRGAYTDPSVDTLGVGGANHRVSLSGRTRRRDLLLAHQPPVRPVRGRRRPTARRGVCPTLSDGRRPSRRGGRPGCVAAHRLRRDR